jgi:ABC-type lipoprotein release transport system permease subunit
MDSVLKKAYQKWITFWLSILPFPLLSVITAMVGLLKLYVCFFFGRQHDFGILKAMGAKDSFAAKIVFWKV